MKLYTILQICALIWSALFFCACQLNCEEAQDGIRAARQEVAAYARAVALEERPDVRAARALCLPAYLNGRICSTYDSGDYIPIALDAMKDLSADERIDILQSMMSNQSWFGIITSVPSNAPLADMIYSMWSDAQAEARGGGWTRTAGLDRILCPGVQGVYVTRAIIFVGKGDTNDLYSLIGILDRLVVPEIDLPAINLLNWISSAVNEEWPLATREQWFKEVKSKWGNEKASLFHKLLHVSHYQTNSSIAEIKDLVMRLWGANDHEYNGVRSFLLYSLLRLNEIDFLITFIENITARPYSANNEKMLYLTISTVSHCRDIKDKTRLRAALDKVISRTIDPPEDVIILPDAERYIVNTFQTRAAARQARGGILP